jgi:DNA polymerase III delta prime subunit
VLQSGKEAYLLKQWLETLQVQSVETGSAESGGNKITKPEKPARKKRKSKLDDFIVDSDDEEAGLDEISGDEADWKPAGGKFRQKTVVRPIRSKNQGRLPNAAIISGPHGSGKTAAVYAVAKELGFEVFEINSSSRRSGKDILERVGDMTRNHLVQHHSRAPSGTETDAEDELAKDLKSGKQGMMTTFFKPKATATTTEPSLKKANKEIKAKEDSKSAKSQKQSLILFEEVDVLYEEDKQFWATLMSMVAQSKRPFIMTCNDENLIPIQSLNLHGIFRFSPPPIDLALDLCVLIAANEGHALRRAAVEALYKSRDHDLRATITELNYWCQIGVGDRRGGFDWFYLRWPKGSDLDENGDIVRVISEDTYLKGMGWIGRDLVATTSDALEGEQEVLHQCWDSWHMPVGDWHRSMDMECCFESLSKEQTPAGRLESLVAYEEFSDNLSASDICCRGAFGNSLRELIDPGLPELPAKTKEDFIIGRQLLEASVCSPTTSFDATMSMSLSSLSRQKLFNYAIRIEKSEASAVLTPVGEDKAISILESSFGPDTRNITRMNFSIAFDPIAVSTDYVPSAYLDPSVFDGTLRAIVVDIAPWVRGIVAYDDHLMHERKKLSSLLSEGGSGSGPRKRMRTTRSAYSALEGGERKSTRRERYFQGDIDTTAVLDTGMKAWREAVDEIRYEVEADTTATDSHQEDSSGDGE